VERALLALLIALLLVAAPAVTAMPAFVPVLQPGDAVPDLPLLDQRGRTLSLQGDGRRMSVLSFIFTRCADPRMCPLVSAKFARLQHLIDPARVRLILITLDPQFDRPAILLRYGKGFGELEDRWLFAWSAPAAASELSQRLGVISLPNDGSGLAHTEALVFIDRGGRIADRIDGNAWSADGALAEIESLINRPANPFAALVLALSRGVSAVCGGKSGLTLGAMLLLFSAVLGALALIARRVMRTA
jgi:cytochrome oxidase Cu insertion factor (SCO1/SenC/PrrC family)